MSSSVCAVVPTGFVGYARSSNGSPGEHSFEARRIATSISVLVTMVLCALDTFLGLAESLKTIVTWLFESWCEGQQASLPPVFLTTAGYYGTLAAVRSLGRAGIPVTVADNDNVAVAKFSRYATTRLRCPNLREEGNRFLDWLLAFGRRSQQKHVLLPTCDDTAWLYSRYQSELTPFFHLNRVPVDAVYTLLNKRRLTETCIALGIDVPNTATAETETDLHRMASELRFPLLIKPSTQVYWKSRQKGLVVRDRHRFVERYHHFVESGDYLSSLVSFDPRATRPIIQEYYQTAKGRVYNLAGYLDEDGSISAFRASTKVLQVNDIGTGICFEEAEVRAEQVESVRKLFRATGYHGIFEIEFIQEEGKHFLIDANPRFYGELAFEVERGMPLPLLAYFQALGDKDAVRSLARSSQVQGARAPRAHTHRFGLEALLRLQRLAGSFSADQEKAWRDWRATTGEACSDAVLDDDDVIPCIFDAAAIVYNYVRYPRSLLRTAVENRLGGAISKRTRTRFDGDPASLRETP